MKSLTLELGSSVNWRGYAVGKHKDVIVDDGTADGLVAESAMSQKSGPKMFCVSEVEEYPKPVFVPVVEKPLVTVERVWEMKVPPKAKKPKPKAPPKTKAKKKK